MENDHYMGGKPTSTTNSSTHAPKKSDLMSSAKVMADAAKSALAKDTEKIDKAKVAGAAADLLGAAKHYAKLEENNFGKYVGKAETYLHQYHSSHATPPSGHAPGGSYISGDVKHDYSGSGPAGPGGSYSSGGAKHDYSGSGPAGHGGSYGSGEGKHGHSSGGGGGSGGGYGDYVKLAQGLLNKKQDHGGESGGSHSSGGGAGDYIKLAQGLLNKKQGHGGEGGNGHSSGGGAEEYIKLAQGFLNKKH